MQKTFLILFLASAILAGRLLVHHSTNPVFGDLSMLALICLVITLLFMALMAFFIYIYPKNKELVFGVSAALMVSLVTFLIADKLLFVFLIGRLSPQMVPDNIQHHIMKPNTSSIIHNNEFSYTTRTNSFGLRGKELTQTKPENVYRIALLGDSFTLGKGVTTEKNIASLIEKNLKSSKTIEVINGGVDSYAPVLSYLQLKNTILPLDPDIVILNLDISDLEQEQIYRQTAVKNSAGEIIAVQRIQTKEGKKPSLNSIIGENINRNFYFLGMVFRWLGQYSYAKSNPEITFRSNNQLLRHTLNINTEDYTQQWNDLFQSIFSIRSYCTQHQIPFVLAIYPWGHQVNENEWIPGRWHYMPKDAFATEHSRNIIKKTSDTYQITLIDTFDAFRNYNGGEKLYYNVDIHWTEHGYQVMARELVTYLESHLN